MSRGFENASRGAWENANFWQRMNPAAMISSPKIAQDDYLEQLVGTHHQCPSCSRFIKPRGYERHLRACSVHHWRTRDIPF